MARVVGRSLIYEVETTDSNSDLWAINTTGGKKPVPIVQTEFHETEASISPDGRWLAYVSDESGREEVYVRSVRAGDGKWQISRDGGREPRWRGDGKEMFYLALDGKTVMAVPLAEGLPSRAEIPTKLFSSAWEPPARLLGSTYAVSADGRRFLMAAAAGQAAPAPITVVLNWTATLKK